MGSNYALFEGDGFSVESNSETAAQLAEQFAKPEDKVDDPEDAAGETPAEGAEAAPADDKAAPGGNGEPKKANPRKDLKARALQAAREATEAKREAAEYRQRLEALEAKVSRPAEAPAKAEAPKVEKPEGPPRPALDDYDSIEDHAEAVASWVADKREVKQREEQRKAAADMAVSERQDKYADRMEEHIKTDPDFWLRQSPNVLSLVPISNMAPEERSKAGPGNALAEAFLMSDRPSALIEYFKDESELQRILSTRNPIEFQVELRLIEKGLGAAITATAPAPESSKAAPPARPVTGGPPIGNDGPGDTDSDEDYIRKRNAQEAKRRSR